MRAEDSVIEMDIEKNSKFKPLISPDAKILEESNDVSMEDEDYKMIETYKMAKTVKLYAGIDTFINGFYVFYNPWYIIPTLISVFGYFGALEYNFFMLCFYFVYQAVMIIVRLALNIDSLVYKRYSLGGLITMVAVSSLLTIFDLYILRFIFKMIKYIKTFSKDDIIKLKNTK